MLKNRIGLSIAHPRRERRNALDARAQTIHILRMATKTISVTIEAYDKLRRARRYPSESFTQVIMRAAWPDDTITAAELLSRLDRGPASFTDAELDAIDRSKAEQQTPEDKWNDR